MDGYAKRRQLDGFVNVQGMKTQSSDSFINAQLVMSGLTLTQPFAADYRYFVWDETLYKKGMGR